MNLDIAHLADIWFTDSNLLKLFGRNSLILGP